MKITDLGRRLLDWLRNGFVLSKTVFFISGLVFTYALVKKAVVELFFDFLKENLQHYWIAITLFHLLDLISAMFKVGVTHVSQAYTGRFSVIIFCAAAYPMGLMLLWVCALLNSGLGTLIFAIVLIALGKAGGEPTLRDFFDYQLSEKVKKKCAENNEGQDKKSSTNLWWFTASFIGYTVAVLCLGKIDEWWKKFDVSSIVMGAVYLLFFVGVFCYYPEESPSGGSALTTIYRVFIAAFKNRRLPYPSSKGYYSNNRNESSNDSEDPFFWTDKNGEIHLSPRVPSFLLFLDKAAIIDRNPDDAERKKGNGEVCTVEHVRD